MDYYEFWVTVALAEQEKEPSKEVNISTDDSIPVSSHLPELTVSHPPSASQSTELQPRQLWTFADLKNGKDTLHDTVGIIYQNIEFNTSEESEISKAPVPTSRDNSPQKRKRRRRTFEAIASEEIPFPKKTKMTSDLQITADEIEHILPNNLQLYTEIDNISIISHALELPDMPMWVGFNCKIHDIETCKQHISYLTPINASPTSNSVVLETMQQSKNIAEELNQSSTQVTYDLAIAKVALQIQATEKPTYDNLFIHLEPFHIMMACFKAVGKNYARWTVKYVDNLIIVADTHPDLFEGFQQGYFGIKRTTKPFSRQPIDLVLEQTINADAARRLTGVIHFTNSILARQRWARNHDFLNPFSSEVPKDHLINISSGKAASELVESFLLNIEKNDINEAFSRKKLRNFDASSLPPSKSELLQQFLRANYVSSIWNNGNQPIPTIYQPENNGWVLEDNQYHFKWFEGDQLPNFVRESLKTISENDEEEEDDDMELSNSDEENDNIDYNDDNE
ncbi:jg13427 [Pararge aegeria aegeria]|uniref:Jg13427 protein n=1 Tax=Pararge aegeria aegeria TaxID=348720 RepID=A0A8S4RWB7_9NEOP|nr:jg13427 [Pararge aegeria aegeria]